MNESLGGFFCTVDHSTSWLASKVSDIKLISGSMYICYVDLLVILYLIFYAQRAEIFDK